MRPCGCAADYDKLDSSIRPSRLPNRRKSINILLEKEKFYQMSGFAASAGWHPAGRRRRLSGLHDRVSA